MEALYERVRENMAASGGIWHRSSNKKYFIYCVGQSLIKQKAFMSWAYSNDIGVKPLFGCYKGQSEQSFISNYDDFSAIKPWLEAEESILLLGACNSRNEPKATLKLLQTGEECNLGRLRPATREYALGRTSWTFDPFTQQYYVCV